MADEVLYDDGRVVLDAQAIVLRRYYFPFGNSKRIAYSDIRDVSAHPMGWFSGKARGWGSANPGYWLPLDMGRPHRTTLLVLDLGKPVKPAFSPDEPERVLELLRDKLGETA